MRTISLTALRRLAMEAQGYTPRARRASTREVEEAIGRASCIQLDSISSVERSHRIASRVGDYAPFGRALERLRRTIGLERVVR